MKTLEVRCCCDATKILGHLAHPKLQKPGDRAVFPMIDNTVLPDRIVVLGECTVTRIPMLDIELTVDEVLFVIGPKRVAQLAIKNRDYPLKDLKRIPGFVVNNVEAIDG